MLRRCRRLPARLLIRTRTLGFHKRCRKSPRGRDTAGGNARNVVKVSLRARTHARTRTRSHSCSRTRTRTSTHTLTRGAGKKEKNIAITSPTQGVSNSHEQEDIPSLLLLPLPPDTSLASGKLPLCIKSATCQDLSDLTLQYGPLPTQRSPEVRSQYVSTLWKRIIPLFQGLLTSAVERRPESSGEDGDKAPEMIKQKFEVFGSYPAVFMHTGESAPAAQLPQVINEAESP